MIKQENFMKAWNNRRLVAGALKAASVRRDYTNYEDLLHDGILLYAQLIEKWSEKPQEEIDKLAFRKIIWQTIDSLRKIQRQEENCTQLDNAYNLYQQGIDWDNLVMLKDEVKQMSTAELFIFFEHLLKQRPITELVGESGVSRITLQRIKKELLLRLRVHLQES